MELVQCPFCKTGNRLGKAMCKKCSRPLPQVEDVRKAQLENVIVPNNKSKIKKEKRELVIPTVVEELPTIETDAKIMED